MSVLALWVSTFTRLIVQGIFQNLELVEITDEIWKLRNILSMGGLGNKLHVKEISIPTCMVVHWNCFTVQASLFGKYLFPLQFNIQGTQLFNVTLCSTTMWKFLFVVINNNLWSSNTDKKLFTQSWLRLWDF